MQLMCHLVFYFIYILISYELIVNSIVARNMLSTEYYIIICIIHCNNALAIKLIYYFCSLLLN